MSFPNYTISYSTTKLEYTQNKIEKIKSEYNKLNRNCEIEVIFGPNHYMIIFDGYIDIKFQLSIY
ncbi:hypothetical protein [Clostridium tyrobutyricum]|jgi:hypothetical protein|uniref:hypothetical protein n=1 Tax=Clostridium tyrobutyricum TaxID=1519 RepID=UPI00073DA0FB|nr:hypothetical protein [Clostridium tyrobutyricum]MCI1652593.1 hypothetical protein [Clostridium tyrobutyricum]MCI2011800.1 hypothetical protein [Clostridium tyrobutyricum]